MENIATEFLHLLPKYTYLLNGILALSIAWLFYKAQNGKLRVVFMWLFITLAWRDLSVFIDIAYINGIINHGNCLKLLISAAPEMLMMLILARHLWKTYQP